MGTFPNLRAGSITQFPLDLGVADLDVAKQQQKINGELLVFVVVVAAADVCFPQRYFLRSYI